MILFFSGVTQRKKYILLSKKSDVFDWIFNSYAYSQLTEEPNEEDLEVVILYTEMLVRSF